MDPSILIQPSSPTTPFEFLFEMFEHTSHTGFGFEHQHSLAIDSVTWMVGLPQVYGLKGDVGSYVRVMWALLSMDVMDKSLLAVGGANICTTGILALFIYVVSIPHLQFQSLPPLGPTP